MHALPSSTVPTLADRLAGLLRRLETSAWWPGSPSRHGLPFPALAAWFEAAGGSGPGSTTGGGGSGGGSGGGGTLGEDPIGDDDGVPVRTLSCTATTLTITLESAAPTGGQRVRVTYADGRTETVLVPAGDSSVSATRKSSGTVNAQSLSASGAPFGPIKSCS